MKPILMLILFAGSAFGQNIVAPFILTAPAGGAPPVTPYALLDTATYAASTSEIVLPITRSTDGNRFDLVIIEDLYGTLSSVTGGGQTGSLVRINNAGGLNVRAYGITNPAAGSGSVTVTMSGSTDMRVTVYTFSGIDQTTPVYADFGSSGTSSTPSRDCSSSSGMYVIDGVLWEEGPASVGADQTVISNGTSPLSSASSYEVATGATTTMSWTLTWGSYAWNIIAVAINPDGD